MTQAVVESPRWIGCAEAVDDGSVKLRVDLRGVEVEVVLNVERNFGAIFLEGKEEECGDAMTQFGVFLERRRIVAHRLLAWARLKCSPEPPHDSWAIDVVTMHDEGRAFLVRKSGVEISVVVAHDLYAWWPGAIGPSIDPALAWGAYDAVIAYLEQHPAEATDWGYEKALFQPEPGDPIFGSPV